MVPIASTLPLKARFTVCVLCPRNKKECFQQNVFFFGCKGRLKLLWHICLFSNPPPFGQGWLYLAVFPESISSGQYVLITLTSAIKITRWYDGHHIIIWSSFLFHDVFYHDNQITFLKHINWGIRAHHPDDDHHDNVMMFICIIRSTTSPFMTFLLWLPWLTVRG